MGRLQGRHAFITAAGAGIGRASALAFAREGATVVASDVDGDALDRLKADQPAIETHVLDVTDAQAVDEAARAHAATDVLFSIAGWVHHGSILDCSPDDWNRSVDLNLTAMYSLARAFLPAMLERRNGVILTMSSVASSVKGVPDRFAYSATKAGVIGLTKAIAADFVSGEIFRAVGTSANHSFLWTACRAVETLGNASGQVGIAAGQGGMFHGSRHSHRITRVGDGRIEQHTVSPQFEGFTDIARRTHTGIDNHRVVGIIALEIFQDDFQIVWIEQSLAAANRAAGRHHTGRPGRLESHGGHGTVAGVAQHMKTIGDQLAASRHGLDGVREQGFAVAKHFQLDPIGSRVSQRTKNLTSKLGGANRINGRVASGGVGQQGVTIQIQKIQNVLAGPVVQTFPPHRYGHAVTSRRIQRITHLGHRVITPRAHDQSAAENVSSHG